MTPRATFDWPLPRLLLLLYIFFCLFRSVPDSPLSQTVSSTSDTPKPLTSILVTQRYRLVGPVSSHDCCLLLFDLNFLSFCRQTKGFVIWDTTTPILRKRRRNTSLPSKTWWSGSVRAWLFMFDTIWYDFFLVHNMILSGLKVLPKFNTRSQPRF